MSFAQQSSRRVSGGGWVRIASCYGDCRIVACRCCWTEGGCASPQCLFDHERTRINRGSGVAGGVGIAPGGAAVGGFSGGVRTEKVNFGTSGGLCTQALERGRGGGGGGGGGFSAQQGRGRMLNCKG